MRRHVTSSLYPTGRSAVRLCNIIGDALHYDAFITFTCHCSFTIYYPSYDGYSSQHLHACSLKSSLRHSISGK